LTQTTQIQDAAPHIQLAIKFGIIVQGNTLEEYIREAVAKSGYETVCIWGVQGSGKSNRAMQIAYWIYKDWGRVLENIIFKPSELVERLEAVPDNERIPCLIWDDVGVHYPSSKFKTDIKEYEAVDEMWAAIRTKVSVIILTIPLINRLAKNLKDNITFEVFLGRNQYEIIKRVYHLPGTDQIYSNFFKVNVEWPGEFNLFFVPLGIWKRYWSMRLKLTNEAIENLKGVTDMEVSEDYLPVKDAALLAGVNPNTLQQSISRGVYRGRKFNDLLYIRIEDLNQYLESKGKPNYTPHNYIMK
jgi:hypothetical protein